MKTAIYIEDGLVQLVITPETEFEKNSLSTFSDKPLVATLFAGSFYDCRGGWKMQTAYRPPMGQWDDRNHKDNSLILTSRPELKGENPMIEEALAEGVDTTGLCTVRTWAEAIVESRERSDPFDPRSEMTFTHNGKRYNVEMVVTKVEDAE